jgi:hypothetical protein
VRTTNFTLLFPSFVFFLVIIDGPQRLKAFSPTIYHCVHIVACLLKARLVNLAEIVFLLANGSANTPLVRQWVSSRHVMAVTIERLLEAVCSVRSMPKLYNEGQLPLRVSRERL